MAYSRVFSLLVFATLCSTGLAQQNILGSATLFAGDPLNITCSANRVKMSVDDVRYVYSLSLHRTVNTDTEEKPLVLLNPFLPANDQITLTADIPSQWQVQTFGMNDAPNNRDTLRILMIAPSVTCNDAGQYRCSMAYYAVNSAQVPGPQSSSRTQNLTAQVGVSSEFITPNPNNSPFEDPNFSSHPINSNVTIQCGFNGPDGMVVEWQRALDQRPLEPFFTTYPYSNDIQTTQNPSVATQACKDFVYRSNLHLDLSLPENYADNNNYIYKCIGLFNGNSVVEGNMTIATTGTPGGNTGQQTDEASKADVGMIVGIVIGVLALIIIVIVLVYFLWYRKRNKGDSYKEEERPTENNPDLHAPPPVFYSKPSKPPKDESDGHPPITAMTNDAFDTSYDSKDSSSRGPPRYVNTLPDDHSGPPHYDKETHRGRSNRGYNEDDRDGNGGRGRRYPRERDERRDERSNRSRDHNDEPRSRRFSNEDGAPEDYRHNVPGMGDPSIGTAI